MKNWLVTLAETTAAIPPPPAEQWAEVMRRGTMYAGLYAPREADDQTPHNQDELYIVWTGRGIFYQSGERRPFRPGDLIFVPAHAEHRFEDFSDDFSAWVVFWGKKGGEGDD